MESTITTLVLWWHSHLLVMGWWWSWAVWGSGWTRVVLAASPRETDARVTDWVTLHLVDSHLGCVALNELDESTALSGWDLDVGDLSKALEERAELILGDIARQTSNKDSSVVWISELVHWLRSTIVTHWGRCTHRVHAWSHASAHTATGHTAHNSWGSTARLVLWSGRRDAHRAVTAVNTLHLGEGTLLVALLRETNKAVTTRHA